MDTSRRLSYGSKENLHKAGENFSKWANSTGLVASPMGESLVRTNPDAPAIICLLKAIGFKLRSYEKCADIKTSTMEGTEMGRKVPLESIKIEIECGTSSMKAVLELDQVKCHCPNPDDVKDASFWSISGTGPTGSVDNILKIEETGSNLLPLISKETYAIVRNVCHKLFDMIAAEPDLNRNMNLNSSIRQSTLRKKSIDDNDIATSISRSRTDPEMRFSVNKANPTKGSDSSVSSRNLLPKNHSVSRQNSTSSEYSPRSSVSPSTFKKPPLVRQTTWDIETKANSVTSEPRASSPKISVSPAVLAQLDNSLGQISLQSNEQDPQNLLEVLLQTQRNLENALGRLKIAITSISAAESSLSITKPLSKEVSPIFGPTKAVTSSTLQSSKPYKQRNTAMLSTSMRNSKDIAVQGSKVNRTTSASRLTSTISIPVPVTGARRRTFGFQRMTSNDSLKSLPAKPFNAKNSPKKPRDRDIRRNSICVAPEARNRIFITPKRRISPEQEKTQLPVLGSKSNEVSPITRAPSMLKPPTKILVNNRLIIPSGKTPQSAKTLNKPT